MKAFIAYRSSGEDPGVLEPLLTAVRDALSKKGIDAYCTFFNEQAFKDKSLTPRQILKHAFKVIDGSDFLFVLQSSDNKSGGMLIEIGYTLAKGIPIAAAVKNNLEFRLIANIADANLAWTDSASLVQTIQNFEFGQLRQAG